MSTYCFSIKRKKIDENAVTKKKIRNSQTRESQKQDFIIQLKAENTYIIQSISLAKTM